MGVRIEVGAIGDTRDHHYGHGASGGHPVLGTPAGVWILSWQRQAGGGGRARGGACKPGGRPWLAARAGPPSAGVTRALLPSDDIWMWRGPLVPSQLLDTEFRTPEIEANLVKGVLFSHPAFRRLIGQRAMRGLESHTVRSGLRPRPQPGLGSTRGWPILSHRLRNVSDSDLPFQAALCGAVPGC